MLLAGALYFTCVYFFLLYYYYFFVKCSRIPKKRNDGLRWQFMGDLAMAQKIRFLKYKLDLRRISDSIIGFFAGAIHHREWVC